jgi:CubicO group peptidase (beta-lactamase class C family)
MTSLEQVGEWRVGSAAAAVVGPSGVLDSYGPVDEPFRLASVTKPLAALAILVAVEEEAVTLDDPADEALIPGATLRHLLAHASGLAPDRPMRSFPPATRRVYSNVGIELAATLVERATGMAFAKYLDEAVVRPLDLHATTLPGSPARDGRSSAADLARIAYELISPTGLLSAPTLADATSVQYPGLRGVLPGFGGQDPNDWGLGLEIRDGKSPHWTGSSSSPRTFGHFGQSGTFVWFDPEAGVACVALTDRAFGPWAIEAWPVFTDGVLAEVRG